MSDTLIPARPEPGVYKIQSQLGAIQITLLGGENKQLTSWAAGSKGTDQQWQIAHLGGGEYSITNYTRGFLISLANGREKQAIAQFQPPEDANGRWTFEARDKPDSGNYYIRNALDKSQVLDVWENNTADGTSIYSWYQNSPLSENQTWNLVP